jgi:IS605 OrfB family transposase
VGEYQREYLEVITDGEGDNGSAEVHLSDSGAAFLHLTVTQDVEVYEPDDVPRWVGVDIGENVLYAATVVAEDDGEVTIEAVDMERGREFRHHRERLKQKRSRLQEQDDLRGVRAVRDEHRRYTKHVLDTASRRIVDLAIEHAPCAIAIEDLTHYRETADDPIHDFPYAELQQKISYKATDEGIPVTANDPAETSITCRKCGETNPQMRDGSEFECWDCGYEVHADVNAAINIALRETE